MIASSKQFLACLFILLAYNGRYKGLKIEIANDFTMGQSNYPNNVVAAKRLLKDYIAPFKSTYVKQEPDDAGVAFSKTDSDNNWKKNFSCHRCGLKGHQLKACNKTSPEEKKKIYAMKKAGTFKAKKTGLVNAVVKGMPGDDASAASSVPISGSDHDQYQRFIVLCEEDPVELFNIGEEEAFNKDDAGFFFDFCNFGDIGLIDIEDTHTSYNWMIISDVVTDDITWRVRPSLIGRATNVPYVGGNDTLLAARHTIPSSQKSS